MSKLADLIRRITRVEPAPIGFGSALRKPPPTMLLVALAGDRWPQAASDAAAAGANALLLTGRPDDKELVQTVSAAEGRPCGILTSQVDAQQLSRLREAGLDFLVLELQAPASALLDQELGFVLRLKDELTDTELRALDALPLDAIYLEREPAPPTIQRQVELQRLSSLARRPLLLVVRPDAEQQDLLCLRDVGVGLVALDLKERGAVDALRRLRKVIDALPTRRRLRREERPEVTLPRATVDEAMRDEEEEEE